MPNNSQHDDQSMFAGFNNSEIMMGEDRVDSAIDDINPNIIIEEHHNNANLLLDGTILEEIKKNRLISESSDKAFLEDIMHKVPRQELTPSLQDGSLAFFWFGWLMMVFTLTYVRWSSPGGGVFAGLTTLFILTIISVCLHSLLLYVA